MTLPKVRRKRAKVVGLVAHAVPSWIDAPTERNNLVSPAPNEAAKPSSAALADLEGRTESPDEVLGDTR